MKSIKIISKVLIAFFSAIISLPLFFTTAISATEPVTYTVIINFGPNFTHTSIERCVTEILDITYIQTATSGFIVEIKCNAYGGHIIGNSLSSGKIAEQNLRAKDVTPAEFDIVPMPKPKVTYIRETSPDDRSVKEKENLLGSAGAV